jgi:hypothetical protein
MEFLLQKVLSAMGALLTLAMEMRNEEIETDGS